MWRSFAVGCASIPLSVIFAIAATAAGGWKLGAAAFFGTYGFCFAAALLILIRTRHLSEMDLWMPVPIAVIWSIFLSILSVGAELFTVPACIGSAILFSASLSLSRKAAQSTAWVILPAVVFIYEMLPVNIPGPFDDYFAFGGAVTLLVLQNVMRARLASPPPPNIITTSTRSGSKLLGP